MKQDKRIILHTIIGWFLLILIFGGSPAVFFYYAWRANPETCVKALPLGSICDSSGPSALAASLVISVCLLLLTINYKSWQRYLARRNMQQNKLKSPLDF